MATRMELHKQPNSTVKEIFFKFLVLTVVGRTIFRGLQRSIIQMHRGNPRSFSLIS